MALGLVERLKDILAGYPQILAAYLYGSYSVGGETPLSDIDLAVVSSDRSILLLISGDIARELDIPEERVSIADLGLLDPLMRLKILRDGVELVNKGLDMGSLIPMDGEVVEVYEAEEAICEEWLRGDPLDVKVIREIIARINEDLTDLGELLEIGYDDVIGDKHLRKSFERTMQTLIESIVDLLRHVVAGLNLGVAAYYKDYFDYAERAKIISESTADEIRGFIPVRHLLVHRYRGINYDEVWKVAEKLRIIAEKLIHEIIDNLRERHRISI